MNVYVTKDLYDGSQSKTVEMNLENLSASQLMFLMMNGDVCGVTITKKTDLTKAVNKMQKGAQDD